MGETFSAIVTKLCQAESGKTTDTRNLADYDITSNIQLILYSVHTKKIKKTKIIVFYCVKTLDMECNEDSCIFNLIYFLLVAGSVIKKKVDEQPKTYFENAPQNVFASAGQNVLLPCRVRHLNDKVVSALDVSYNISI